MRLKDFEELKYKYIVNCEFAETNTPLGLEAIKESACIFGYNYKVKVSPLNETTCRAHFLVSGKFDDTFKKKGVRCVVYKEADSNEEFIKVGSGSEFYIDFNSEDLDIVAKILKFKTGLKSPYSPYSVRSKNPFLRFQRNIHERYGKILEERLAKNEGEE